MQSKREEKKIPLMFLRCIFIVTTKCTLRKQTHEQHIVCGFSFTRSDFSIRMLLSSFICDFSVEKKIYLTAILLRLQGQFQVYYCALKHTQKLSVVLVLWGPLRVTSITLMLKSRPWTDAMNRNYCSAHCTLHAYKCIHVRDERVTCGSKNEHVKYIFTLVCFVLLSASNSFVFKR